MRSAWPVGEGRRDARQWEANRVSTTTHLGTTTTDVAARSHPAAPTCSVRSLRRFVCITTIICTRNYTPTNRWTDARSVRLTAARGNAYSLSSRGPRTADAHGLTRATQASTPPLRGHTAELEMKGSTGPSDGPRGKLTGDSGGTLVPTRGLGILTSRAVSGGAVRPGACILAPTCPHASPPHCGTLKV